MRADELVGRQDLAAGDAVEVGDQALDLGDPTLPEPVLHVAHGELSAAPDRPRRTRRTGGVKWGSRARATPDAIARRARIRAHPRTETASIVPSGAIASTTRPSARTIDALAVQRVDLDGRGALQQALQHAIRHEAHRMDRRVALRRRHALVGAVVGAPRAAGAPPDAACRRARRSAPAGRGRSRTAAPRARAHAGSAAGWWRRGPGRAGCPAAARVRRRGAARRWTGCR